MWGRIAIRGVQFWRAYYSKGCSNRGRIFKRKSVQRNIFCFVQFLGQGVILAKAFKVCWNIWQKFFVELEIASVSWFMNQKILHTLPRKNMNLLYSISMYWTSFWQPTVQAQQNIFLKPLIEASSSHLYASFGTFCVQIGPLFEAQWVLEKCLKTVKSLFLKENDVDFEFFQKFKASLWLE